MASSTLEKGVFVDTNLGTHLAIAVCPDITAREFKRQFEREHFNCFSEKIQVSALMVERKSCLYHLPDTLNIKNVFWGVDGTWFLHAEARALSDCNVVPEVVDHVSAGSDVSHPSNPESFVTSTTKSNTKCNSKGLMEKRFRCQKPLLGKLGRFFYFTKNRKRRKNISLPDKVDRTGMEIIGVDDTAGPTHIDKNKTFSDDQVSRNEVGPAEEYLASTSRTDELAETSSEAVVSVSGIINKYFSNLSEDAGSVSPTTSITSRVVQSSPEQHLKTRAGDIFSSRQVTPSASTKFSAKKLLTLSLPSPSPIDFGGRRYKHNKPEVGKRLVMASYSLGVSPSKKHPAIRLCSFKQEKV